MKTTLYDECMQHGREELLRQWNDARNGTLTPETVPCGSKQKVWWLCEKGHEWQAIVKSRVGGSGCPVCARRVILPGENDLASTHAAVAAQWHPEKNGNLTPQDVAAGTLRKVWWRCERGHEWQATVASRTSSGADCPVCAGKQVVPGENDLASMFPEIAAQWHPDKNGAATPETVTPASNRRVWWLCGEGHAYSASVASRTVRRSGCPYCTGRKVLPGFNDLATKEPKVAEQWHPELNGALTPEQVTAGSHRKVWWRCPAGHVWKAVIVSRTDEKKRGCPVCAGKVSEERAARYQAALSESLVEHGKPYLI